MAASTDTVLVLVDHGSRSAAANASLKAVAASVAAASADRYLAVLPAHMELASPSLAEAFEGAVAAGARRVVVALYFLAPGRHSVEDVPRLAAEAAARHPGLRYVVTAPLGPHALLDELLLRRADEADRSA